MQKMLMENKGDVGGRGNDGGEQANNGTMVSQPAADNAKMYGINMMVDDTASPPAILNNLQ